jgi:hypothetical protein
MLISMLAQTIVSGFQRRHPRDDGCAWANSCACARAALRVLLQILVGAILVMTAMMCGVKAYVDAHVLPHVEAGHKKKEKKKDKKKEEPKEKQDTWQVLRYGLCSKPPARPNCGLWVQQQPGLIIHGKPLFSTKTCRKQRRSSRFSSWQEACEHACWLTVEAATLLFQVEVRGAAALVLCRSSPRIFNLVLLVMGYGTAHKLFGFVWKGQMKVRACRPFLQDR